MNDQRTPIIDPYRTIRRSFVVICGGHLHSAVLLDYFVMVEHALDEARTQGERFGPWRAVAVMHAARIMQYDPNKRTVMATLDKLQQLGFIEAHPQNANNKGGYAKTAQNRYRLCIAAVLDALREYRAVQNGTASDDAVQNSTALLVNFAPHTSAEMHGSAVQKRTQESVVESVYESSSSSTEQPPMMMMMSHQNLKDLYIAFAGQTPTAQQIGELSDLANQYDPDTLVAALRTTSINGSRSLKYARRVLENPKGAAPANGARPAEAIRRAPAQPEPIYEMPAEKMEALAADLRAVRARIAGGAS